MYFLLLMIMEMIPLISDSNGVPVLALPLGFVVGISMIKDIYEDYLRHRSDNEENNRKVLVAQPDS
jgi:phospholipid-transporting ATPase